MDWCQRKKALTTLNIVGRVDSHGTTKGITGETEAAQVHHLCRRRAGGEDSSGGDGVRSSGADGMDPGAHPRAGCGGHRDGSAVSAVNRVCRGCGERGANTSTSLPALKGSWHIGCLIPAKATVTRPLLHRLSRGPTPGVYVCGAKERDGARCSTVLRFVTCPGCRQITREQQARAKARNLPAVSA